jgi:hypothetical protein
VMVAAGEEVAQFVGEKNGQQSGGEGQADKESGGVFVEESEGAEEFVERGGLMVGIGDGELGAGGQTSTESEEEQRYGEDKGFEGRAGKHRHVKLCGRGKRAPIIGNLQGVHGGV